MVVIQPDFKEVVLQKKALFKSSGHSIGKRASTPNPSVWSSAKEHVSNLRSLFPRHTGRAQERVGEVPGPLRIFVVLPHGVQRVLSAPEEPRPASRPGPQRQRQPGRHPPEAGEDEEQPLSPASPRCPLLRLHSCCCTVCLSSF